MVYKRLDWRGRREEGRKEKKECGRGDLKANREDGRRERRRKEGRAEREIALGELSVFDVDFRAYNHLCWTINIR